MALARPLLKRYHAHPFSSDCVRCCPNSGEHRHLTSDEHQARDLARTVIRAYENQPVKGTPLYLPDGRAVAADARRPRSYLAPSRARHVARPPPNPQVWADLLHDELFEILERDDALSRMRTFSTEKWLQAVVEDRGDARQRALFADLLRQLSFLEGVDVADVEDDAGMRCGLPKDMFMVDQQPLMEVEVYRGLDDIDLLQDQAAADKGDDDDDDADAAEGAP